MRALLLILTLGFLSACATNTPPPPVEEASDPIQRDAPPPERDASSNNAARALLAQADTAMEQEDLRTAVAYLERAIRLEPRDAELWLRLADAHLSDNNLPAANQHVRKAIALAGENQNLSRSAWLKLADIREAEGKVAEAEALRSRYGSIR